MINTAKYNYQRLDHILCVLPEKLNTYCSDGIIAHF